MQSPDDKAIVLFSMGLQLFYYIYSKIEMRKRECNSEVKVCR